MVRRQSGVPPRKAPSGACQFPTGLPHRPSPQASGDCQFAASNESCRGGLRGHQVCNQGSSDMVQSGLIRVHQMSNQGSSVAMWCNQGSSVASTWLAAWNEALKSLRVLANRSDLSFSLNFSCRMRIPPTFLTMPLRAPQ